MPSLYMRSTYEKAQQAAKKRQGAAGEGAAGGGGGSGGAKFAQNLSPGGQHRKICAPEGAKGATRRALQRAFACATTPGRFFIHSKVARKSAIPAPVGRTDLSLA
jgi:hypothetical protein